MNDPTEQFQKVQISNTEYLRLLIQTDPKHRDRLWCIQLEEHLTNMENHQGCWRLQQEREFLREVWSKVTSKNQKGKIK